MSYFHYRGYYSIIITTVYDLLFTTSTATILTTTLYNRYRNPEAYSVHNGANG